MTDANDILIEALLDEVLDTELLEECIGEALQILQGETTSQADEIAKIERELKTIERERTRLVTAIAAGGQLDGLLQTLQARETKRTALEARREQMRSQRRLGACPSNRL